MSWSISPCSYWCVCDQTPWCSLIIWTLSLLCTVGGSSAQIRLVCSMFSVTLKQTMQWQWCCSCLKNLVFPNFSERFSNLSKFPIDKNTIKKKQRVSKRIKGIILRFLGEKKSPPNIIQMCEISSVLWFCDTFSAHKLFSQCASVGCWDDLLQHMKETRLSRFLQMFAHLGTASEKKESSLCGWQFVN